jgi:hypothetical protein
LARFYVFDSQAEARACVDGVDARARQIYRMQGFTEDPMTGGFLSKDASGNDIPGAVTETFAEPRQRTDGKWIVPTTDIAPFGDVVVPVQPPMTVAAFVALDIATSVPVDDATDDWWPAMHALGRAV